MDSADDFLGKLSILEKPNVLENQTSNFHPGRLDTGESFFTFSYLSVERCFPMSLGREPVHALYLLRTTELSPVWLTFGVFLCVEQFYFSYSQNRGCLLVSLSPKSDSFV
ncbi:hypothetical protein JTE90_024342 [Oedothorax gibbosus]|uniref:Uncharacterized protein n=1 Tax=Oedothorax gibbosus TaxID=931172 RepID=A0AAV6VZM1_9ARAC|nr:hypothetical protein JTE90_024342 [Oedothorax gibbosus]